MPSTEVTPLKAQTTTELSTYLLDHKADVDQFRLRGPFDVGLREDMALPVSATETLAADLYLSSSSGKSPLVVFVHGYDNAKDDHAYQAYHVATWGMHALSVSVPNHGPWVGNGRKLVRLAQLVRDRPELFDARVDGSKIVLVGHSFGGASAAIALAERAPVLGAVLLDPASIGKGLPAFLRRIDKPVLVLGADRQVSAARGRANFFRYIPGGVAEISIRGATHEDAQFALETSPLDFGLAQTEAHQITFASAITAAAFSLASTGRLDYAWASFGNPHTNQKFFDARKK